MSNTSIISNRNRDCAGCRIVSGSGLIGVGAYIAYHSRQFQKTTGKVLMIGISGAFISLGAARLLNLPPFQDQFHQE